MFGGLTVALVTGVPLGTFIGQHFGWRETFLAVSILGVIALMSSLILVPNNIPRRVSAGLRAQLQVLTHPRLLIIYAITALGYGGVFTAFTFTAPMMQDLADLAQRPLAGSSSATVYLWRWATYGAEGWRINTAPCPR